MSSITNTLLPCATAEIEDKKRYEKILDFLKNFAANYRLVNQSKKNNGNTDQMRLRAYRMLIKTIVFLLFDEYPTINNQYFRRKQSSFSNSSAICWCSPGRRLN